MRIITQTMTHHTETYYTFAKSLFIEYLPCPEVKIYHLLGK